jgi:RNA polymerase sigma factor (sigma-70 family)
MNPEDAPGDVELLRSLWAGELDAFEALYQRYAPTVMRYAWARLGDRSGAEEILQETFLTVWTKHRRATIVDRSLLPWLLSITGNHLRNVLRKNARRQTLPLVELPDRAAEDLTGLVVIEAALASLSDIDRRICELCLIEGHSYGSAASEIELSEGAVRKRLQRARANLRAYLSTANERRG